jgi:hypothetical protein
VPVAGAEDSLAAESSTSLLLAAKPQVIAIVTLRENDLFPGLLGPAGTPIAAVPDANPFSGWSMEWFNNIFKNQAAGRACSRFGWPCVRSGRQLQV